MSRRRWDVSACCACIDVTAAHRCSRLAALFSSGEGVHDRASTASSAVGRCLVPVSQACLRLPASSALLQVLLESPAGREDLQRCDVAAFLFDAQQPGARPCSSEFWALGGQLQGSWLPLPSRAVLLTLLWAPVPCSPPAGSFRAARERMLAVASAAGDVLPCLFLEANEVDASPQLVRISG